ncbi:MAG: hypothetical protein ABIJ41_05135 [Candidatus Omnitrophota bacterium]
MSLIIFIGIVLLMVIFLPKMLSSAIKLLPGEEILYEESGIKVVTNPTTSFGITGTALTSPKIRRGDCATGGGIKVTDMRIIQSVTNMTIRIIDYTHRNKPDNIPMLTNYLLCQKEDIAVTVDAEGNRCLRAFVPDVRDKVPICFYVNDTERLKEIFGG